MSSPISERRQWIRKLRDDIDHGNAGSCPVCLVNAEAMAEQHRREVERYRGVLMQIAGQENSRFVDAEGDVGLSLDAEEKMREIARRVLL